MMMMMMYLLVKTKKLCTFTLLAVTAPFNNCAVLLVVPVSKGKVVPVRAVKAFGCLAL